MNKNLKRFFSLSAIDSEYLNDKQEKFEFVKCPGGKLKCKDQLSVINKIYGESEFFHREKNYHSSIQSLKNAFYITLELTEKPCNKCAEVFRMTVIDSLENIRLELKKITTGIFGSKKYKPSLVLVEKTLDELKSYNLQDKFEMNRTSDCCDENNSKRKIG